MRCIGCSLVTERNYAEFVGLSLGSHCGKYAFCQSMNVDDTITMIDTIFTKPSCFESESFPLIIGTTMTQFSQFCSTIIIPSTDFMK